MTTESTVWIGYENRDMTHIYEGNHDGTIPFDPAESEGVQFKMDEMTYEIAGDLGGHCVYSRVDGDDTLYALTWGDVVDRVNDNIIQFDE